MDYTPSKYDYAYNESPTTFDFSRGYASQPQPTPQSYDPYTNDFQQERRRSASPRASTPKPTPSGPRQYKPRTPSPPIVKEPREQYLAVSLEESTTSLETAPRKLLILDLNGTLCVRASHPRANPLNHAAASQTRSADGGWAYELTPKLRTTHARPFMTSFAQFLGHSETRKWLDTMVWSSAQPHSVKGMVEVCFGQESPLVAVWARDTLGLSRESYHQKSPTSKDLEKVWSGLSLTGTSSYDAPVPGAEPTHSAKTTILLDDSAAKASMQPWNHICIREYVHDIRANDVALFKHEMAAEALRVAKETESNLDNAMDTAHTPTPETEETTITPRTEEEPSTTETLAESESNDESLISPVEETTTEPQTEEELKRLSQKRKKASKKARKKARVAEQTLLELGQNDAVYDETLLAVVGVLDCVRAEGNVAGWLRKGGLINTVEVPVDSSGNQFEEAEKKTGMWFEDDGVLQAWAQRGREVLERLGIDVIVGITIHD